MSIISEKLRFCKGYKFQITLIIILIIIVLFSELCIQIRYRNKSNKESLAVGISSIQNLLKDSISAIVSDSLVIGKEISITKDISTKRIAELMGNYPYSAKSSYNFFISTLFDWVDSNDMMLITSNSGILQKPINISQREYLKKTRSHPWELQIQNPAVGIPSGQLIIPAGIGVTDESGKYIGAVTMGFALDGIRSKIDDVISLKSIKYAILSENNTIIASNIEELRVGNIFTVFPKNVGSARVELSKYYPIKVIAGHDKSFLNKQIYEIIQIELIKFILIGLLISIVLFLFKRIKKGAEHKEALSYLSQRQVQVVREEIDKSLKIVNNDISKIEKEREMTDEEKQMLYSMMVTLRTIRTQLFEPHKLSLRRIRIKDLLETAAKLKAVEIFESKLKVTIDESTDFISDFDEIKMVHLFGFIMSYISKITASKEVLSITLEQDEKRLNIIKVIFQHPKIISNGFADYQQKDGTTYSKILKIIDAHELKLEYKPENKLVFTVNINEEQ